MVTLTDAGMPRIHRHPPRWVGDVIAAALIVIAALVPFPGEEFRPSSPVALIVMLLPAVILPLRRRWPIPILAACIACYGAAALMGTVAPGVVLAAAVAMFGVATRSSRRTTLITAGAAVLAVVVLSLLAAVGGVFDPRTFQFAITIAFASAAGDATRSRREYIQAITDRALRAEQTRESEARRRVTEERLRIARDLHDAVAHQISVISLNAGVASTALPTRPEKTAEALATIRTASRTVLNEIGDLLEMLRADDDDPAASTTGQPRLDRIGELIGRFGESGLDVALRVEGDISVLPFAVDVVAYRVVQEGLTNAHKHGAEHRAHVLIAAEPDAVRVVVTNPVLPTPGSASASASASVSGGGHGLLGLRERVASVRGTVETGTTPGGYRVAAVLPVGRDGS